MHFRGAASAKRHANLSVREDLLEAARAAGVNLSDLLERAIVEELAKWRRRQWSEEHAQAVDAYHRHIEHYGTFSTGPGSC